MEDLPTKCSLCWKGPPPTYWESGLAPPIPSSKPELVKALEGNSGMEMPHLQSVSKLELKHMFKTLIRGERHLHDPTRGMSGLNKPELIERLKNHGLEPPEQATKGKLMACLREHWVTQCYLAKATHVADPGPQSSETWDAKKPDDDTDQSSSIESAMTSMETMVRLTNELYGELSLMNDHRVNNSIEMSKHAREQFLLSIGQLVATSSSQ